MHDDRALFELLALEGTQAGLSWSTMLRNDHHLRIHAVGWPGPGLVNDHVVSCPRDAELR